MIRELMINNWSSDWDSPSIIGRSPSVHDSTFRKSSTKDFSKGYKLKLVNKRRERVDSVVRRVKFLPESISYFIRDKGLETYSGLHLCEIPFHLKKHDRKTGTVRLTCFRGSIKCKPEPCLCSPYMRACVVCGRRECVCMGAGARTIPQEWPSRDRGDHRIVHSPPTVLSFSFG